MQKYLGKNIKGVLILSANYKSTHRIKLLLKQSIHLGPLNKRDLVKPIQSEPKIETS